MSGPSSGRQERSCSTARPSCATASAGDEPELASVSTASRSHSHQLVPIHRHVGPQQRRQRRARIEPDVLTAFRKRRRGRDDLDRTVVFDQAGRGGAVVRERDRRPARIVQGHARELAAGERQRRVPQRALNTAPARLGIMEGTAAAHGGQQYGPVRRWAILVRRSSPRQAIAQRSLHWPMRPGGGSDDRALTGMGQPEEQHAPL